MDKKDKNLIERPPVIVVMGHIDHGKSTLLDYIRKTNVVEKEAGGITQRISAYEVDHKDENGKVKKITFLDTPGHEAFSKMRERGAKVADIAILIVSAEDGVKPQTIEAWKTITESNIPYFVAINKIDKPGADIEKTKMALAENEIYLENYGGKVPFVLISAKTGEGVDELLSLIKLMAEMEDFKGSKDSTATGFVIEANMDPKRGIEASIVIKDGSLKKGMTVVVEDSICSTRIIQNFKGEQINEASFSSPIRLIGFSKMPKIGSPFVSFEKKKDAEEFAENYNKRQETAKNTERNISDKKIIPIVLKADVSGSLEALEKEIGKIQNDTAVFKVVIKGEGSIMEKDIKSIADGENALVIGFNVKADASTTELASRRGIVISYFDIIYKMTDWLKEEMENRRPKKDTLETIGKVKVLKAFSKTKERQILGGKVIEGKVAMQNNVKIMRRDFEIGKGKVVNLEKGKMKVGEVEEGFEFGMMIESKFEIAPGDVLESFSIVQK